MTATKVETVCLYYGEGAEDAALDAAEVYGRIEAVLGSEKGVRKDDARAMLALHNSPPASDGFSAVVIGPMDLATVDASDALLKVVEEPSMLTKPFLWAYDLGQVSKTIRSRCHTVWSYQHTPDEAYKFNTELLDQALDGNGVAIAELLLDNDPKLVLNEIVRRMSDTNKVTPRKWELFKAVLGQETVSSVASALAQGGGE